MLSIGLTGGIGSGKTAVSDIFGTLGVPVIDTDLIARELVEPGQPALTAIVECFGPACLTPDKRLNRAYLRQCIFTDPIAKKNLENILHPRTRTEVTRRISQLSVPYCIVVIPLLVEINASNAAYALDRIL
ncbi:MAG: dephospho-CoA kinase, partial [Candidatus Competibacteraceae bacterium]|nr:dephospho-CoA kinase [Candidatus Competibacteraceae bacterium]